MAKPEAAITIEQVYKRLLKIELKSDALIADNVKIINKFTIYIYFLILLMLINILLHIYLMV